MDPSSSSSDTTLSPTSGTSQDSFDELAKNAQVIQFKSIGDVTKRLNDCHMALLGDRTREQFLFFAGVPESVVTKLSDEASRPSKLSRVLYSPKTSTLVLKVVPGPDHEIATRELSSEILLQLNQMNVLHEIDEFGSSTVRIGDRVKEADMSWAPSGQTGQLSTVVETGLSESSRRLALNARGWLETAGSTVELVVTLDLNRDAPQMAVKRWELHPRPPFPATRNAPEAMASTVQTITVSRGSTSTTSVSDSLTLPFAKFVGRDPNNSDETDLVIGKQALARMAERVWRYQGLL